MIDENQKRVSLRDVSEIIGGLKQSFDIVPVLTASDGSRLYRPSSVNPAGFTINRACGLTKKDIVSGCYLAHAATVLPEVLAAAQKLLLEATVISLKGGLPESMKPMFMEILEFSAVCLEASTVPVPEEGQSVEQVDSVRR